MKKYMIHDGVNWGVIEPWAKNIRTTNWFGFKWHRLKKWWRSR